MYGDFANFGRGRAGSPLMTGEVGFLQGSAPSSIHSWTESPKCRLGHLEFANRSGIMPGVGSCVGRLERLNIGYSDISELAKSSSCWLVALTREGSMIRQEHLRCSIIAELKLQPEKGV